MNPIQTQQGPPHKVQPSPEPISRSLWQSLPPPRQQQMAQTWAELIQRMRRQLLPAPTRHDHEHA
jgi:TRAP-type C4-dicarboxylate transport system substrate-binding protein